MASISRTLNRKKSYEGKIPNLFSQKRKEIRQNAAPAKKQKPFLSALGASIWKNKTEIVLGAATGGGVRLLFTLTAASLTAPAIGLFGTTLLAAGLAGAASGAVRETIKIYKQDKTRDQTGAEPTSKAVRIVKASLKGCVFGLLGGAAASWGLDMIQTNAPAITEKLSPLYENSKEFFGSTWCSIKSFFVSEQNPTLITKTATPVFTARPNLNDYPTKFDSSILRDVKSPEDIVKGFTEPSTQQISGMPLDESRSQAISANEPIERPVLPETPAGFSDELPANVFAKLPEDMQKFMTKAAKSGSPKSMMLACKEASFYLINKTGGDEESLQAAGLLILKGLKQAAEGEIPRSLDMSVMDLKKEDLLIGTKVGQQLLADYAYLASTGKCGIQKDHLLATINAMLADQKNGFVTSYLSMVKEKFPDIYASAQTKAPQMIQMVYSNARPALG